MGATKIMVPSGKPKKKKRDFNNLPYGNSRSIRKELSEMGLSRDKGGIVGRFKPT